MKTADLLALGSDLAEVTKAHVARTLGGLITRLEALETRLGQVKDGSVGPVGPSGPAGPPGPTGEPGQRGADGDVGQRGPAGEPGQAGTPGADGVKGDRGSDGPVGAIGPPGPPGERGDTGQIGDRGLQGERGLDAAPITHQLVMDALSDMHDTIDAIVVKYLTAHPVAPGHDGMPGAPGQDGVGLAGALLNQKGELVLTLTSGVLCSLGRVVGEDGIAGVDGKDGADGLGYDDFTETLEDGGRVLVRRYARGEQVKEFRHQTAVTLYRGVWKDGTTYAPGDVVSYGGIWHANELTTIRPGGAQPSARAWTLMAREGRTGKEGKTGPAGPMGPKGPQGDQGRHG